MFRAFGLACLQIDGAMRVDILRPPASRSLYFSDSPGGTKFACLCEDLWDGRDDLWGHIKNLGMSTGHTESRELED
jgi:hypothetical protein